MDNRGTSADVVFEYTGVGCSVPKDVTSVRFNDGLQKIGVQAFSGRTSLKRIKLPSTVTEIGSSAFHYCSNLREVIFNVGLRKIADSAFYNCTSLESITFPPALVDISFMAFYGCSNLRVVTLNDGLLIDILQMYIIRKYHIAIYSS